MSKKKLNPSASSTNFMQLPADFCDCGEVATCNHFVASTVDPAALIEGVTVDGTYIAFESPIVAAEIAMVNAAIIAAIESAGYYEVQSSIYSHDGVDQGTFNHTGEATINSVTIDGAEVALSANCTPATYCDFNIVYGGADASVLTLDGVDTTFANALTYGTSTTDEVIAEFETALPAGTVVSVEDNGTTWIVSVSLPKGTEISVDGKSGEECGCYTVYTA